MHTGLLFAILSASYPAAVPSGQDVPPRVANGRHVTVELVAAQQAADEVWAGVRFRLDPGWHVYWRNPGDSGGPPRVQWTRLPPGWSAGQIEWPAPQRIPVDRLVNYGYSGEVLLPVRLTPPRRDTTPGAFSGDKAIVADVRWIVCRDVCVPGKAAIGLSLDQIASPPAGQWAALMARARALVPRPAPKSWRATFRDEVQDFTVSILVEGQAEHGTFFPIDESQIDDAAPQQVNVSGQTIRFRLRKSDQLTTTPTTLRGVVVFTSGIAYEILAARDARDAPNSR
jgi:DsbC/DsbD-like thiol-disulfide interchange protein